MKATQIIAAGLLLTMLPLTGCSLLNKGTSSDTAKKTTATPVPSRHAGKGVKQEAVLPTDKHQIATDKAARTYTAAELMKGVIKGDWAIETVNGKKAVGEKAPFLMFAPKEHRVYGNNGCNVLNATYKYNPADSTISFGEVATTMMACAKEGITDYEINQAMSAVSRYSWKQSDSQFWLYFYDRTGREVMSLMHQNFDFLNGTWAVTAIDEEPVKVTDMRLVFDIDEGKIHGNTGCNIINGTMETDRETANAISIQDLVMTRMACDDPSRETQFLVALESIVYARPIARDKVLMMSDSGKVVLTLVRTTESEE